MALIGRRTVIICFLLAVISSVSAATLVGRVYSDDGRPVDGVLISAQPTIVTSSGLPQSQTITDTQGKFVLTVAEGEYSVCAVSDHKGLLNSCEWDLDHSVVTVKSPLTQFTLTLQRGVTLRIRLNDPSASLSRLGPKKDAFVSFILWDAIGHSHYLREIGGDDKGKNLELLVPPDASLRLTVQNYNVDVLDASGISVSKSSVGLVSRASDLGDTRVYQVVPVSGGRGNSGK
jgi:hypothetical protein